jgi:hypothetical protein
MYTTIFTLTRPSDKQVTGYAYSTKSLSPYHERLRARYSDAQTWQDCTDVITEVFPGVNIGTLPVVRGGTRIA